MDTACFLRKRSVLTLWLIAPLALTAGTIMISRSLLDHAQITYMQSKALERLIPELSAGLAEFDQFAANYQSGPEAGLSEERHVATLNAAAEQIDFTVSAINLAQDPPGKTPAGTARINILIKGMGSAHGIGAFLNNIHARDPFAYEKKIQIMPDSTENGRFALEAEFCKIQIKPKGTAQ
jgi:hypothetical protein